MFGCAFRVIAKGGFASAQKWQARFKTPAHVFQKGRAGSHVKLQHFSSQFQFEVRIAFRGEALQRAAILGEGKVDVIQILQMRCNTLAAFEGSVIRPGACWFPRFTYEVQRG